MSSLFEIAREWATIRDPRSSECDQAQAAEKIRAYHVAAGSLTKWTLEQEELEAERFLTAVLRTVYGVTCEAHKQVKVPDFGRPRADIARMSGDHAPLSAGFAPPKGSQTAKEWLKECERERHQDFDAVIWPSGRDGEERYPLWDIDSDARGRGGYLDSSHSVLTRFPCLDAPQVRRALDICEATLKRKSFTEALDYAFRNRDPRGFSRERLTAIELRLFAAIAESFVSLPKRERQALWAALDGSLPNAGPGLKQSWSRLRRKLDGAGPWEWLLADDANTHRVLGTKPPAEPPRMGRPRKSAKARTK